MDAKLQQRVQRYGWDEAANAYERCWQRHLRPAQDKLLEMAGLVPGASMIDVACGSGLVTLRAARLAGAGGRVVGTDLSDRMIDEARTAAVAAGLSAATFLRMDAEDLSFEDDSFDFALCALGLMYVPNPERAIQELHRVLRPGGRAAVAVWGDRKQCGWSAIFAIVDARVRSEVCPLFFRLGQGDALARALSDAGFVGVASQRLSTTLDEASEEEACLSAFVAGPVALAYDHLDESARSEVHAEYLASLSPFRRGSGFAIPGEFVVVAGSKPSTASR